MLGDIERAARFLYLNRFSFNGIYRENKEGRFNVPKGSRTGKLPDAKLLARASLALRGAVILAQDFEDLASAARKGTLYYLDPPYDYSGRLDRGEYGTNTFSAKDIPRLSRLLESIHRKEGKFILSYLDVPDIKAIAEQYRCIRISVKRQVASFAKYRTVIKELIVTNT